MAALHFIPTDDCILRMPAHDHPDQIHGIELFEQAGMRFLRVTPHGGTPITCALSQQDAEALSDGADGLLHRLQG